LTCKIAFGAERGHRIKRPRERNALIRGAIGNPDVFAYPFRPGDWACFTRAHTIFCFGKYLAGRNPCCEFLAFGRLSTVKPCNYVGRELIERNRDLVHGVAAGIVPYYRKFLVAYC